MIDQPETAARHDRQLVDITARSGLDLRLDAERLALDFGPRVVHPRGERRTLDQIRSMLEDPRASGPEHLYTIYMDIHDESDAPSLRAQGLLYGAVVYNHGVVGHERLRSQGHIHSEKPGTGLRYSEIYEFWTGHGYVYLQKECAADVTRAFLVEVGPGDKLVIPFGWVHLVVTLGDQALSFGAWCARANHLEYEALRALGGPAHFVQADGTVLTNPRYRRVADVQFALPRDFPTLDVPKDRPIYASWREHPDLFAFMASPERVGDVWSTL
jgi:glucose-6-phosphate isomerase